MIKYFGIFLPVLLVMPVYGATVNKTVKTKSEYHEMCGCKYVFWKDKLEGIAGQPDFVSHTDVTPGAYGSAGCNRIDASLLNWATLTLPSCVVAEMAGKNNRLTGAFRTVRSAYVKISGGYTAGGTAISLERVYTVGTGGWKEFNYYFDFTGITNVTDVKLNVNIEELNGVSQVVDIDEIRICHFCDGSLSDEFPMLSGFRVLDGTSEADIGRFLVPFDKTAGKVVVAVPPQTTSVKIQPTLLPNTLFPATGIKVNGNTVGSGNKSSAITVNFSDEENYPSIEIELNSSSGPCPVKTYYQVDLQPEEPLADATLLNLRMVDGDQKLDPGFYRYTLTYNVKYPPGTQTVQVVPVVNEVGSTITVNTLPVESGNESQEIDVSTTSTATIVVTSRKNPAVQKTYTVNFAPKATMVYVLETGNDANQGWPNWSDAKRTIEAAIAEAKRLGPTPSNPININVGMGRYRPQPINSRNTPLILNSYINLYGGFPANGGGPRDPSRVTCVTYLDADWNGYYDSDPNYDADWAAHIAADDNTVTDNLHNIIIAASNCIVDGFIITHAYGKITMGGDHEFGAIKGINMSNLRIENCSFKYNYSSIHGAAVCAEGSQMRIRNSVFQNNSCRTWGGAVCSEIGALSVENSTFELNSSQVGGAIYATGSLLSAMNNSILTNNIATSDGGGIYSNCVTTYIDVSTFVNNHAQNGGAIFVNEHCVTFIVANTRVNQHTSTSGLGIGGGVFSFASNVKCVNTIFYDNHANGGGGIFLQRQVGTVDFVNCLFYDNGAPIGGGIYLVVGNRTAIFRVLNSTFNNNISNDGGGLAMQYDAGAPNTPPLIKNTIIWNIPSDPANQNPNAAYYYSIGTPDTRGCWIQNYQELPTVRNPQFQSGFQLASNSPCLNIGEPYSAAEKELFFLKNNLGVYVDLTNLQNRFVGTVDIGAYERQ